MSSASATATDVLELKSAAATHFGGRMAFTDAEAWLKDISAPTKLKHRAPHRGRDRDRGGATRLRGAASRLPSIPSGQQLDTAAAEVKQLQEENDHLKEEMEAIRERLEQLQGQLSSTD